MKLRMLFLAWAIYLWLGIRSGDPMQLFFALFFFLLHLGTFCHRREMRLQEAKAPRKSK